MFQLAVLVLAWIAPCKAFLRVFPVSNVRSRSSLSAIAANLAAPLVPPSPTVTAPDAYDWTFLDDVYLITTTPAASPTATATATPSTDRLSRTAEQLRSIGLWARAEAGVRRFAPDNEDRVRGCYTSHVAVLQEVQRKYANKGGDYAVLVLEDNVVTTQRCSASVVNVRAHCTVAPPVDATFGPLLTYFFASIFCALLPAGRGGVSG